jgi:hypothetical protein
MVGSSSAQQSRQQQNQPRQMDVEDREIVGEFLMLLWPEIRAPSSAWRDDSRFDARGFDRGEPLVPMVS